MARNVVIVLARDFSGRLQDVAFRHPVWLIETPENRAAAEKVWSLTEEWPQMSVTIFRGQESPRRDDWLVLLNQIELHHGATAQRVPYDALEVVGTGATPAARAALFEFGFMEIEETIDGFRARRRAPPRA